MLARYLSILLALILVAPAAASASPLADLAAGSLASGSVSMSSGSGSGSATAEPNYDPVDPASGRLIATTGFDVQRDGFSFDNWGPADDLHRRSLTPSAMRSLYGDDICARIVNGECVLSATGAVLQSTANKEVAGGHCYGMAALAGLFHTGGLDKADYLQPGQTVFEAQPSDELDRLISRYWAAQISDPSEAATSKNSVTQTVRKLMTAWGRGENFILSFFDADGMGGHAVTPIALRSLEAGRIGIVVYDNNFPGVEKMFVTDPGTDSWYYTTATNPSEPSALYVGSRSNRLRLTPLQATTQIHECPVCADAGDESVTVMIRQAPGTGDETGGEAPFRLTTPGGGPVPGLTELGFISESNVFAAVVPAGVAFDIAIANAGTGPAAVWDVTLFGDGWTNVVDGITLGSGASASVSVSADQRELELRSSAPVEPLLAIAEEQANWSVEGVASGLTLTPGMSARVERQIDGDFVFSLAGEGPDGATEILVRRRDVERDYIVGTAGPVPIPVGASASVAAGAWDGTAPLTARVVGAGVTGEYPLG